MPRRTPGQHFLLSAAARSLSLRDVMGLTEQEAAAAFRAIRWAASGGEPTCPECGCLGCYEYASRPIFKCKGCGRQFSLTSGTIFAGRKLSVRDHLLAIVLFVNAAKGISSLQLARDLGVQYKTAFVLTHKLREAMAAELKGLVLDGTVEVDGCHVGGHVRPENEKADRKDRRLAENTSGKRRCVVVLRQRGAPEGAAGSQGRTLPFALAGEAEGVALVRSRVAAGSVIHADEAASWDALHAHYEMKRINHQQAYSLDGACTNLAESFFSRLRRAEWGQHHRISALYLGRYAAEMAWREDHRRQSNGGQAKRLVGLALSQPMSVDWSGYWQRRRAAA
ncbi:MAG: IS1595 family transposase [Alphaproteobacteria bacterium]|nr:IS1595 family transposase [Alphaproteobacteria bacterium]